MAQDILKRAEELVMDYSMPGDDLDTVFKDIPDSEVLKAVSQNPQFYRKRAMINNYTMPPVVKHRNQKSRFELIKRIKYIKPEIRNELIHGHKHLAETALMVTKSASQTTSVKMLVDSDDKTTGYCMINAGKLEADEWFMLTGIQLLSGVHASSATLSKANVAETAFGPLQKQIRSGQFEFKANGQTLIPECNNEVFCGSYGATLTDANSTNGYSYAYGLPSGSPVGYYELENPKLIEPQKKMEFNVEWAESSTQYTFLMLIFHGTRIYAH